MSKFTIVRNIFTVILTIVANIITVASGLIMFSKMTGGNAFNSDPFILLLITIVLVEWIITIIRISKRNAKARKKFEKKQNAAVAVKQ